MSTVAREGDSDPAGSRVGLLEAAASFQREGRLGDAETIYRSLLDVDHEDFDALLHLGVIKIAQGEPGAAELLFARFATRGPSSPAAHATFGSALLALRRFDDAIAQFRQALADDPSQIDAQVNLGSALQALNRHEEAIACYECVLAHHPDLVVAHYNLGSALQSLHRHGEAISSYERALAIDPDLVEALYGVGTALDALGRIADAVSCFARALAIDPDFAEAALAMARGLQRLGQHADAIPRYEQALGVDPDYVEARAGLATAYQALGRHAEAIACFEAALSVDPHNPSALRATPSYRARGQECVKEGRYEEAFGCYEKALALDPYDARLHANYGFALSAAGRHDEAIARYQQAVSLDPDFIEAHNNLGAVLVRTGRLEEARRVHQRAMELAPGEAAPYLALAGIQRMTRDDPLIAAMERLVSTLEAAANPDTMKLHFALGKAFEDTGQHERSFKHLIAGNALKRRDISYDEAATLRHYERIKRVFTPDLLRSMTGSGDPSQVPIFILGYPRSGSTLVEQVLASHRSVYGAGERPDLYAAVEHHCPAFPDAVPRLSGDAMRRLGAHYVASIAQLAPDAIRITDKLPGNFVHIGLIRLALPNARIIHTCRDPVDTCLSCFSTLFDGGSVPFSYNLSELGRNYRAYAELMAHWRRALEREMILEVHYEEMVANFEREARRIVEFCGLAWDDACLKFYETRRAVRTASVVQVRQPIYQSSVGRARPGGEQLRPLLDALA